MGGFGENFREPQENEKGKEKEKKQGGKEGLKQNNEDLKKLAEDFTEIVLKDPVLSTKIPKIIDKHQELIDKGEERPIVCLSLILNMTKTFLRDFDKRLYEEMELIFKRYKELLDEITETLDEAEYGEFFLNLRDTITEKIKNPENKENKREGELKFVPLVDNPEYSEWLPMFTLNSWYSWKYTPIP